MYELLEISKAGRRAQNGNSGIVAEQKTAPRRKAKRARNLNFKCNEILLKCFTGLR